MQQVVESMDNIELPEELFDVDAEQNWLINDAGDLASSGNMVKVHGKLTLNNKRYVD